MKTLALIPARSGSKRIPGKNFKELNGRRLVDYSVITAIAARDTGLVDWTAVSSDFDFDYGCDFIQRPSEFCTDDAGDFVVINHALKYYPDAELIVYLRPTTPFRALYHIEQAVKQIEAAGENATGLRSVELMAESAFKCFVVPHNDYLEPVWCKGLDITDWPSQDCPETFKPNGYIDIAKAEQIRDGRLWGDMVIGYVTPRTIEIDTPDDWDYAQWWAQRERPQIINFGKEF